MNSLLSFFFSESVDILFLCIWKFIVHWIPHVENGCRSSHCSHVFCESPALATVVFWDPCLGLTTVLGDFRLRHRCLGNRMAGLRYRMTGLRYRVAGSDIGTEDPGIAFERCTFLAALFYMFIYFVV